MTAIIISLAVCIPLILLCIYWERKARREAKRYADKIKRLDDQLDYFEERIS